MTSRPTFICPIRNDPESYSAENPVSAWDAVVMRSNLQYWINLCTQHRVNWVSTAGTFTYDSQTYREGFWFDYNDGAGVGVRRHSIEFVHTWIRSDYPTGLDICIAALAPSASDQLGVVARILPASAPLAPLRDATLSDQAALWESTVTVSGPDTGVIEEQVFFNEAIESSGMFLEHSITEGGVTTKPRQALLRLEIVMLLLSGDEGGITEVLVREFMCQP